MDEGMNELRRENAELRRELGKALERIARLEAENARLRERLAMLEKRLRPAETAEAREEARLKRPEGRRRRRPPGPPEGHPGVTRAPPEHVDETLTHTLEECPECHGPVERVGEEERFTEEFVPARVKVTKHRISRYMCRRGCGHFSAPDPTISGSPFGPNLHAHVALMRHLGIPFGKIGLLLRLQHGLRVTRAALMAMVRPCVVTRRNSHGSKNLRGARDTAVVMSVAVTCRRRGRDFLQAVQGALAGVQPP